MTQIGVIGLSLVWGVEMRTENLQHIFRARSEADARACNALADEPITAVEGGGAAVKREAIHSACDDGVGGEDDEPRAEDAAVVELGVRQEGAGGRSDGEIIGVGPAFLEGDDVRGGFGSGDLAANLGEAGGARRRDVF